jgi:hypothetical protein
VSTFRGKGAERIIPSAEIDMFKLPKMDDVNFALKQATSRRLSRRSLTAMERQGKHTVQPKEAVYRRETHSIGAGTDYEIACSFSRQVEH